jgi:hypothetical protein
LEEIQMNKKTQNNQVMKALPSEEESEAIAIQQGEGITKSSHHIIN